MNKWKWIAVVSLLALIIVLISGCPEKHEKHLGKITVTQQEGGFYVVAVHYRWWQSLRVVTNRPFIFLDPEASCFIYNPAKGRADHWEDCTNLNTDGHGILIYGAKPVAIKPSGGELLFSVCFFDYCKDPNEPAMEPSGFSG